MLLLLLGWHQKGASGCWVVTCHPSSLWIVLPRTVCTRVPAARPWLLPRYFGTRASTEVHVLTAESGYRSFSLQTPTALPPTSPETFAFALAPNKDIYAIE